MEIYSPFNKRPVNCASDTFSFFVSGHFYGSSSGQSGFPASTLLGNLDLINSGGASFLLSLGDLFVSLDREILANYDKSLFSKLQIPLLNVPGNHDLMSGDYKSLYGLTYGYFKCGPVLFVLLDTEINNGSIKGEQLEMLREALSKSEPGYPVFIASHRTTWSDHYDELEGVFTDNTASLTGTNFDEILSLIRQVSVDSPVYWFSGSLGSAPASFFYHADGGITYIATAIRDLPRDAILKVNVTGKAIEFETISLTGKQVEPLSTYNSSYWLERKGKSEPFNYRLIPYLVKKTVISPDFWWGAGSVLTLVLFFTIIRRRRQ